LVTDGAGILLAGQISAGQAGEVLNAEPVMDAAFSTDLAFNGVPGMWRRIVRPDRDWCRE
jgi:hypothetical protein